MSWFDRQIALEIEGVISLQANQARQFRVVFDIEKSITSDVNDSFIEIYNLAESTRNLIRTTNVELILSAGYSDLGGPKVIFIGDVSSITHSKNTPNVITRIDVGDGFNALRESRDSFSFAGGTSGTQVLNTITDSLGINARELFANIDEEYLTGFSFSGNGKDALDKIADRFNLEWSIQNNEIQIIGRDALNDNAVINLDYNSGLLKLSRSDDTRTDLQGRQKAPGFIARSLLNADMEPGGGVNLLTGPAPGLYRIETVRHRGDNKGGEFITEIELTEV